MSALDELDGDAIVLADCDWDKITAAQPPVTVETLQNAAEGSTWCLMDRNNFTKDNWRRIYAT
jgi:hypothetical protein